jgi:23S rRNA (cytosine1962-C5)-methyltransferase
VVQVNTAGMDALTPVLLEALEAELSPKTIVLKNDSPVRELEGLTRESRSPKATAARSS